jgi:peroxiredoxin
MARFTVAWALALCLVAGANAKNTKLHIGDPAPVWQNLPGVDGKTHSLSDLKDKDVVVVVFTCNHCPVAVAYQDRIIDFARKYAGPDSKTALVAINVNNIAADILPKMVERAQEKSFNFPYLYDETQQIGHAYGASVTPEFFVLDRDRKVVYMGAMDDNRHADRVSVNYLEPAVQAAQKGEKPTQTESKPVGCSIKYGQR